MSKYGKLSPRFKKYFKHLPANDNDVIDDINDYDEEDLEELKRRKADHEEPTSE